MMKNLYLFSGQEFKRKIAIKDKLKDIKNALSLNVGEIHLDGEEIAAYDLLRQIRSKPLFYSGKIIWVKVAEHLPDQVKIAKSLSEISIKDTYIIFEMNKREESNPIYKLVKKEGYVKHFSQVKRRDLPNLVKKVCNQKGVKLTKNAFRYFLELIEVDLRRIENEVTKLSWFADGNRLKIEDIKELVFTTEEKNIFQFLDGFGNREPGTLDVLKKLLMNMEDPTKIFYMLAGHVRSLLLVKSMSEEGFTTKEIAQRTGQFGWLVKKKKKQSKNFSPEELTCALHNLHQEDILIKTGQRKPKACVFNVVLPFLRVKER